MDSIGARIRSLRIRNQPSMEQTGSGSELKIPLKYLKIYTDQNYRKSQNIKDIIAHLYDGQYI